MVDVVIVGAGVAGLAAARALVRSGRHVVVIEGRARIGGRIHTIHDSACPVPIELGAEMIHEASERTKRIARESRLALNELEGGRWLLERGELREEKSFDGRIAKALRDSFRTLRGASADRSMADALGRTKLSTRERDLATAFVEGFHAGPAKEISTRALERGGAEGPGRILRIDGGYDRLVDALGAGLGTQIRLGRRVTRIVHRRGEVRVATRGPTGREKEIAAKAVVIAVSLGVVRDIEFDPPLDRARLGALDHLAMADVVKVTLRFREPFWVEAKTELAKAALMLAPGEATPTFWSARPAIAPVLIAWAGGPAAARLGEQTGPRVAEAACDSLATLVGVRPARVHDELETFHFHDWARDPFARGAYSYAKVGGARAAATVAKPIGKTLFFAGEHTMPSPENATVEGAIASGERAAREISA